MSRLDAMIRRLTAQRDCLAEAARRIAGMPGPILELGLGKGRTYDHMRGLFAGRDIFVFDRDIDCYKDCIPPADRMIQGEFRETVPNAAARIGAPAVLAHCDVGRGDPAWDAELAAWLGPALLPLLADGALVLCDQELTVPQLVLQDLPDGIQPGRYHFYRHVPAIHT
ncbi:class I SAM-dependent methyltransferase [Zavarzinia sp. CC-PAN008]|uniref:class I SAM-dependent methyltransferase n=1 Tax=Zavarzinia sp. CC-PAN008 TaxID=3243332 RepID=UPI003F7446FE